MKTLMKFGLAGAIIMLLSAAGPLVEITEPTLLAATDAMPDQKLSGSQDAVVATRTSNGSPLFLTPPTNSTSSGVVPPTNNPVAVAMIVAPSTGRKTLIPMITAAMPKEPLALALPVAFSPKSTLGNESLENRPLLVDPNLSAFGLACENSLTVEAAANEMIAVSFKAPCLSNRALTLKAGEIVLNVKTDIFGHFKTSLPQLTQTTDVSIFDGAQKLVSSELKLGHTPAGEAYVLIWEGKAPLEMFVRSSDLALRREKGKLGIIQNTASPANLTHFTAPEKFQSIRFSLVGTVDAQNCDQISKARLVHRAAIGIESTDLQFRMPGCDQLGKTLELRSVIPDMKMARK